MNKITGKNIILRIENLKGDLFGPGCELIEGHDTDTTTTYTDDSSVIIVIPLEATDKELITDTASEKEIKRNRKIAKLISAKSEKDKVLK